MSFDGKQEVVEGTKESSVKKVNLVIVEDDHFLADIWGGIARTKGKEADVYYDRKEFLENRQRYPKDTKMIINYGLNKTPNGVEVAKILFKEGYEKLYLTTGLNREILDDYEFVPSYLTVLLKTNEDEIVKVISE